MLKISKNQKFGKLTIIEEFASNHEYTIVKCDCGRQQEIKRTELVKRGDRNKCSYCFHPWKFLPRIISGQIFNYITAINLNEELSLKHNRLYWNCRCICGKELILRSFTLINGTIQSCGCMSDKILSDKKNITRQNSSS